MFENLTVGSWANVSSGCPMAFEVYGSDGAAVQLGDGRDDFALNFDADSLRQFLQLGGEALRDMDSRHEQEQAQS
jgi:hypothetical protein